MRTFNFTDSLKEEVQEILIKEVEEENQDYQQLMQLSRSSRGFYTAANMKDLSVQGGNYDIYKSYVAIRFIPCFKEKQAAECAPRSETDQFIKDHKFFVFNFDKYIDFENVMDYENTL